MPLSATRNLLVNATLFSDDGAEVGGARGGEALSEARAEAFSEEHQMAQQL